MKRYAVVLILTVALLAAGCVPKTVAAGGVVVRGEPVPAPAVDYAALTAGEDLVFITPSGKKFHEAGCPYLSDPPIAITRAQAGLDYTPCSRCHPEP